MEKKNKTRQFFEKFNYFKNGTTDLSPYFDSLLTILPNKFEISIRLTYFESVTSLHFVSL